MGDLRAFMAGNAIAAEEVEILVSKRFVDKKGEAIKWKVKAISSKEDEAIRKSCTIKVAGKRGVKTPETDVNAYLAKMVCACIVYPDLNDKDLQDSYGVMGASEALKAMLLPGEFSELSQKIQEINGFDTSMEEMVDEAKNS